MENKKKIALIIVIIIVMSLVCILAYNSANRGVLTEREYMKACPVPLSSGDRYPAEIILKRADIDFDQAFISSIDNKTDEIVIYYKKDNFIEKDEYRYVCLKVKDFSPSEFIGHFDEANYFCSGYNEAFEWAFTLDKKGYLTHYIDVSEDVRVKTEDYGKMLNNSELVETDCELINAIKDILPFNIKEDECFFALDEPGRMVGWFYFKSNYNDEDFVGCYRVSGWSSATTYEQLVNMGGLYIQSINCHEITIR